MFGVGRILSLARIIGSMVSIMPRYGNMMEHISLTNEKNQAAANLLSRRSEKKVGGGQQNNIFICL